MDLPFTPTEFFEVFRAYNLAVWPVQWLLIVLAAAAVVAVRSGTPRGTRAMLVLLSALWLWMGAVYHGVFFRRINPAASLFAALFIIQAALLAVEAVRGTAVIRPMRSRAGIAGGLIVVYGLLIYPVLGAALGHRYPANPTFGLPCPTTLFTLGALLWMRPLRVPLFLIPLAWAVIGTAAALRLGVYEDAGLAVAALTVLLVLIGRARAAPVRHADAVIERSGTRGPAGLNHEEEAL
jgi:hypothetical protein